MVGGMTRAITYPKRTVRYSAWQDSFIRRLTDSPTPAKFSSLLRQVEQGDIAALCEIQQEMESKDGHLQGVCETRRRAVTALDWSIVPDDSVPDDALAKEAAEYVSKILGAMPNFQDALEHLQTAIGPNVAVLEVVWEKARPVGLIPVPPQRLRMNPWISQNI